MSSRFPLGIGWQSPRAAGCPRLAASLIRWKNVLFGVVTYYLAKRHPEATRKLILKGVRKQIGDEAIVEKDFTPRYKPWDQRICVVPDGDLFHAIRSGRVDVVTDGIDRLMRMGSASPPASAWRPTSSSRQPGWW
jgi:cation diffusion facilitator CzcD-associated flavoprotein CzcO